MIFVSIVPNVKVLIWTQTTLANCPPYKGRVCKVPSRWNSCVRKWDTATTLTVYYGDLFCPRDEGKSEM